jgi:tetratricopeptide (TPR) repeat protein
MYQAYQGLRKNDSALLWLGRTDSTSDVRRIDAVSLFQGCGRMKEARDLIDKIVPSFDRDTLTIRQCIFEGNLKGAAEELRKSGSRWTLSPKETLLWKARILLFSGSFDELTSLFDSVSIEPSLNGAKEMLDYRFRLQIFQRSPAALASWSQIECALFTGNPEAAIEKLPAVHLLPADPAIALRLLVIRELLARDNVKGALALFRQPIAEAATSPEYLYLYADAELKSGLIDPAREHLLRIIRDFPDDVFSEKARILLARLEGK